MLITSIRKRQRTSESEDFSIQHTCAHYDRLCFIIYVVRGTGGDKHVEKKITLKLCPVHKFRRYKQTVAKVRSIMFTYLQDAK